MENKDGIEITALGAVRGPADCKTRKLRRRILSPLLCSVCATVGIFGGIAALFIGLVFCVVHAVIAGDQAFDKAGTVLLVTAIPAILIGSIFLDEIGGKK